MERRVDVLGMVRGITWVLSAARRRWNDVKSAEEIIHRGVEDAGSGEVD